MADKVIGTVWTGFAIPTTSYIPLETAKDCAIAKLLENRDVVFSVSSRIDLSLQLIFYLTIYNPYGNLDYSEDKKKFLRKKYLTLLLGEDI